MVQLKYVWFAWIVCLVLGCHSEQPVTVSGGVEVAGTYAYTQGYTPEEYIALARGYTDEALVTDVYVVRVVADSANRFRSTRLAVSDSLTILPGDEIFVPVKTYTVRLDTVRVIEGLRLQVDDQIVHIPRGVLVPGWTDVGTVVGMVIGRGKGYALTDTTTATSAFHYLYCHFHPLEYQRLLHFSKGVTDSLEALEDAHAVHQWLFEKHDYQTDGMAELPPRGYFAMKQGIWLTPRSKTNPGKGMRKRRFEDGRIWTTFGDGRQRWQHPDGRVEITYARGNKTVRYADGRVSYTDLQGNVQTHYRDGREVWTLATGAQSTLYPDGKLVRVYANGDVVKREPDGTEQYTFVDGSVRIDYADGRVFVKDDLGTEEMRYEDGRIEIVTPANDEITLYPDGSQITKKADGSVVRLGKGGYIEKRHASGTVTRISSDGVRNDVFADGTRSFTKKDGTRVVYYVQGDVLESRPDGYTVLRRRDGSIQETFPDGRQLGTLANGASWEVFPDGRKIQVTSMGHRIELFPNGMRKVTLRGVYDYPSPLRSDLVKVADVPDAIAEKGRVKVVGTVVDSVVTVRVLAFEVPHGEVISGKVRRRDGRFESTLRFKHEGHYRLQVQVALSGLRTYTAIHRPLRVGHPDAITPLVLSVDAYPGDDLGAGALVDFVNDARALLGRRTLMVDSDLTRIARVRLREMIIKGEVSHLSRSNEDVRSHMFRERLRFVTVGENVASSHFLETMHQGWMLSAGHRGNILDKRWTHMGAAVTKVGGMLWGVQVFAGW